MTRTIHRRVTSRMGIGIAAIVAASGLAVPGALASAASSTSTAPTTGVPKDFRAQSLNWLSPQQGWGLGAATCSPTPCSDVIGTSDGGSSWSLIGTVPTGIATVGEPKPLGVTEVRFATANVGWAFAPLLVQTTDGAKTWSQTAIPGNGKQVLSLATNAHGAYAVVSACKWNSGVCDQPLTFWHTDLSGGAWTQISLDLPVAISAQVATFGKTVYVLDELASDGGTDKLYASTDGRHFSTRPIPCNNAKNVGLIQVVPISATDVDLLCDSPIGFGQAFKKVFRSTDTAQTTKSAGQLGMLGIQAQLAASPTDNLAVATYSSGSFIYANDSHAKTWSMPVGMGDGGRGWNDIVYTTNKEAWVVYSPAGFFNGDGILYVTRDAGATWAPSPY